MVNYSIIKWDGSMIAGQSFDVIAAVQAVNRAQGDRWSSDGKLFAAAFVGSTTIGAIALVENGGQWSAPEIEGTTAPHTFGSLANGALFTFPGNPTLYRKHDDCHRKVVGLRGLPKFQSKSAVVVPAK